MKSGNNTRRRSRTDWKRIDSLRDEDIDYSDIPEQGPDFFAQAILWPGPKKQITLRLDPDVLAFFRKTGKGYQTTINAVLRKYVESRKSRTARREGTQLGQRREIVWPTTNDQRRTTSCTSSARASKSRREFRTRWCGRAWRAREHPRLIRPEPEQDDFIAHRNTRQAGYIRKGQIHRNAAHDRSIVFANNHSSLG